MRSKSERFGIRIFYLFMAAVLAIGLGAPSAVMAQEPRPFTVTPLTPDSSISVAKAPVIGVTQESGTASVIVKLKGKSLAGYTGGIQGLSPTNPTRTGARKLDTRTRASQAYMKYLRSKHQAFERATAAAVPQAKITQDFSVIMNGVAMTIPVDQISSLSAMPDVEAIYADELLQPATDTSPKFIDAPAVWYQLGGQESSGEGVIVGVLDTGIWPEHPSFSDPDPSGKAYAAPPAAPSGTARKCEFNTGANPGAPFACNNKLIGAYFFMNTYQAVNGLLPAEYTSARDDDGHGTHTSSTSAGNAGVEASIFGVPRGEVSGIAPRAHVIMYRVCGSAGCYSSDSAAAVQQAILDGVDVINFSISGGTNPYADAVEMAFLDAYNAGVFVAASAGNSGPAADTTAHRGPWVTTVAASTHNRAFENTVTLTGDGGASLALSGASVTAGVGPAPVTVPATDVQCNSPFAAGSVAGQIVVCRRGTTGRAEKGYNVLQGGAVGMILYNQAANVTDLETDNHYLPTIHLQYSQGTQVLTFLAANTNVQATLTAGQKVSAQGDVMASFSSRGGLGQTLGVSKPDITAPGVQILAGASPAHLPPDQGGVALGPQGEQFQAIAGTSMSSPHIAGAGALLKALHPDWTPGQIKSAIMTTAWMDVVKEDGVTPATPFDMGSGRVALTKAMDPGITFDVTGADYLAHADDLWNVNYPSIYIPSLAGQITVKRTALSLLNRSRSWQLDVVTSSDDFTVTVPRYLTIPARRTATFNIVIDARDVPIGEMRTATLYIAERATNGVRTLHIPITFIRKTPVVTLSKTCTPAVFALNKTTNCAITMQNTTFSTAQVALTDQMPSQLKVVAGSVVGGTVSTDLRTVSYSGTLPSAEPPVVAVSPGASPAGYLPLSLFGITPVSGVGDETITNFNVPSFIYAGNTYSRVGVVSNGYLVIGGGTAADVQFVNSVPLPNPTPPNNVIAPWWTDLNPSAGGAIRVGTLTDGADTWIVFDWEGVREYSTGRANSFQVWIGTNTDAHPAEDISMTYGTLQGNGDLGILTVGAENLYGNRGSSVYFDGTGTLPTNTTELVVTGAPGAASPPYTVAFKAKGVRLGKWMNYALMTSDLFQGINIASFEGEVTK